MIDQERSVRQKLACYLNEAFSQVSKLFVSEILCVSAITSDWVGVVGGSCVYTV